MFSLWRAEGLRLFRNQTPLFLFSGFLLFVIALGIGATILTARTQQIQSAGQNVSNLAYVLGGEADRSFASISAMLTGIDDLLLTRGVASSAGLREAAQSAEFSDMLRRRSDENTLIDHIYVLDARGMMIASSLSGGSSAPEADLSDRFSGEGSLRFGDCFISKPYWGSISGDWQAEVSRPLFMPSGMLMGHVVAVLKLDAFDEAVRGIVLGMNGSIGVFRRDGVLMTRVPAFDSAVGVYSSRGPAFVGTGTGERYQLTREISHLDGVERLIGVRSPAASPVALVVTMSMEDVLGPWRAQSILRISGGLLIWLAIAVGTVALARRIEQLGEARAKNAAQAAFAEQHRTLHLAVSTLPQGLAMFDDGERLVLCNNAFAHMYGLPAELDPTGVHRNRILAYRDALGVHVVSRTRTNEPEGSEAFLTELSDGRVVAQRKTPVPDGGWVATYEDVTDKRRSERAVAHLATHDPLTGVGNRVAFRTILDRCVDEAARGSAKYAVLYLDLDRFKNVNDTLGHPVGDDLLKLVVARLRAEIRNSDSIARIGGDEFAILQRLKRGPEDAAAFASRLIEVVSEPYNIDGHRIAVGASVGIALAPADGVTADDLIRDADMALYHAKGQGRGRYSFFKSEMDAQMRRRRELELELRQAVAEKRFEAWFQPVVRVADRSVTAFEALIRWRHPIRGIIPPNDFIPIAEDTGLIVPIGEWMLKESCRQAARWPVEVRVAVNVSAVQLRSSNFVASVASALKESGLAGGRLEIEVTESVMAEGEDVVATLEAVRQMGVSVAMDDFGTGFSSLSSLARLPFNKLKIDRSFVTGLGDGEGVAVVRAVAGLARAYGLGTLAEGVETEEQFALLATEGCEEAQGYLFSRPMPGSEVAGFLPKQHLEAA